MSAHRVRLRKNLYVGGFGKHLYVRGFLASMVNPLPSWHGLHRERCLLSHYSQQDLLE